MKRSSIVQHRGFAGTEALSAFAQLPTYKIVPFAICIIRRNPFDLFERETHLISRAMKLSTVAKRHGVNPQAQPTICRVNGKYVLQKEWARTWVRKGDLVEFKTLPLGGSTGATLLAVVLTIALVASAFVLGPAGPLAIGGLLGFAGTTATVVSAVAAAAIVAGGGMLINALVPAAQAASGDLSAGAAVAGASPTYTIGAQSNQARLGQPIPVMYGRHRFYPDYAATPYAYFSGSNQYLNQLYCLGQGEYDIERILIGDADIDRFPGVSYEVYPPDTAVTLFDTNVYSAVEVGGQTLFGDNEDENDYVGPFPACPPGTTVDSFDLDFILPQGLYKLDPDTGDPEDTGVTVQIEARLIDDDGIALGAYESLSNWSINDRKKHPYRVTITRTPSTSGRWEVRVRRSDNAIAAGEGIDDAAWAGLKGRLTNVTDFGDVTLLAVTIRASDSLNSSTARLLSIIGTRKIPVWNGSTWAAPAASQSIAWAVADILRNETYGASLPDDQIDLAALLALDTIWTGRGDTFNGVFDRSVTTWEAISKVLLCGRARPYQQSGVVHAFRDHEQTLPVGMYSTANIKLDSFRIDFLFPVDGETADGVTAEFFYDATWKPKTITMGVDGATPVDPIESQLFGVTDLTQATNEAEYQAAANRYRRVFITFETELEGLIPSFGDPILIAHDIPSWGQSGNIIAYDDGTFILTLDAPIDLSSTSIILRDAMNVPSAEMAITVLTSTTVQLADAPYYEGGSPAESPGFEVVTDLDREPTHYIVATSSQEPKLAIVTNIVPRGSTVEISAVLEDSRVHAN
jgi:hypothetical protein